MTIVLKHHMRAGLHNEDAAVTELQRDATSTCGVDLITRVDDNPAD
jgi:hypothetical protein